MGWRPSGRYTPAAEGGVITDFIAAFYIEKSKKMNSALDPYC